MKDDKQFSILEEDIAQNGEPFISFSDPRTFSTITFYLTKERCSQVSCFLPVENSKELLSILRDDGFIFEETGFWVNHSLKVVAEFKKSGSFCMVSYAPL